MGVLCFIVTTGILNWKQPEPRIGAISCGLHGRDPSSTSSAAMKKDGAYEDPSIALDCAVDWVEQNYQKARPRFKGEVS
jgi:hypothetical protein